MAEVSVDTLKSRIKEIVAASDLNSITSRITREKLEKVLNVDLSHRKKEIDKLVMAEVEDQNNSHSEDEGSEEEETAPPPRKKAAESDSDAEIEFDPPAKRKAQKNDTISKDGEKDDDDDYPPKKKGGRKPTKANSKKRKAGSDDDSDDWAKAKKAPKKAPAAAAGGKKKASAFTKSFKLSPELADVVGSDTMPRHEVVKKLWAVIKERELQDPKNKQFAICDDQLMKVFGVKRFRTFGMMKHLKDHFLEAA